MAYGLPVRSEVLPATLPMLTMLASPDSAKYGKAPWDVRVRRWLPHHRVVVAKAQRRPNANNANG